MVVRPLLTQTKRNRSPHPMGLANYLIKHSKIKARNSLQMLSNIADAVLEATHREKEATKRALADKTAEAAAYRAARDQRDGNLTPRE